MIAVAVAHTAARCPFANPWCHEPGAQQHVDQLLAHQAAPVVFGFAVLFAVIAVIRWRRKRARKQSRRQASPYPNPYR